MSTPLLAPPFDLRAAARAAWEAEEAERQASAAEAARREAEADVLARQQRVALFGNLLAAAGIPATPTDETLLLDGLTFGMRHHWGQWTLTLLRPCGTCGQPAWAADLWDLASLHGALLRPATAPQCETCEAAAKAQADREAAEEWAAEAAARAAKGAAAQAAITAAMDTLEARLLGTLQEFIHATMRGEVE